MYTKFTSASDKARRKVHMSPNSYACGFISSIIVREIDSVW